MSQFPSENPRQTEQAQLPEQYSQPPQPPLPGIYSYAGLPLFMRKWPLLWIIGSLIVAIVLCSAMSSALTITLIAIGSSRFLPGNQSNPASSIPGTPTPVPLVADTFSDNSHGWVIGKSNDGKISFDISNGALRTWVGRNEFFETDPVPPAGTKFSDFSLKVDTKLVMGNQEDSAVVLFRAQDANNGYLLQITPSGDYRLVKFVNGKLIELKHTTSAAIHGIGKTNTLVVTARGKAITVTVNGTDLVNLNDTSYSTGLTGLGAAHVHSPSGALAEFRNLIIYP